LHAAGARHGACQAEEVYHHPLACGAQHLTIAVQASLGAFENRSQAGTNATHTWKDASSKAFGPTLPVQIPIGALEGYSLAQRAVARMSLVQLLQAADALHGECKIHQVCRHAECSSHQAASGSRARCSQLQKDAPSLGALQCCLQSETTGVRTSAAGAVHSQKFLLQSLQTQMLSSPRVIGFFLQERQVTF